MSDSIDISKALIRTVTIAICGDRCSCGGKGGKCRHGYEEEAKDSLEHAKDFCTKHNKDLREIEFG